MGRQKSIMGAVEDFLRFYCYVKQSEWETFLSIVEFVFNSVRYVSTGFVLIQLIYGKNFLFSGIWSVQVKVTESEAELALRMQEEL